MGERIVYEVSGLPGGGTVRYWKQDDDTDGVHDGAGWRFEFQRPREKTVSGFVGKVVHSHEAILEQLRTWAQEFTSQGSIKHVAIAAMTPPKKEIVPLVVVDPAKYRGR